MNFKLMSWNVMGLNNRDKRRLVNNLIMGWKADIICLQETKLEGNVVEVVKQVWGGRWIRHAALEANGTRGGSSYCGMKGLGRVRCLKLAHTLSNASLNHNSKILIVT